MKADKEREKMVRKHTQKERGRDIKRSAIPAGLYTLLI